MIKVETNEGKISIEVRGDLAVILADLTTIISSIYEELPDGHQTAFLDCISECIPNLVRKGKNEEEEESNVKEDNELLEEAAEIAMALLKWRDNGDFNLPD